MTNNGRPLTVNGPQYYCNLCVVGGEFRGACWDAVDVDGFVMVMTLNSRTAEAATSQLQSRGNRMNFH